MKIPPAGPQYRHRFLGERPRRVPRETQEPRPLKPNDGSRHPLPPPPPLPGAGAAHGARRAAPWDDELPVKNQHPHLPIALGLLLEKGRPNTPTGGGRPSVAAGLMPDQAAARYSVREQIRPVPACAWCSSPP